MTSTAALIWTPITTFQSWGTATPASSTRWRVRRGTLNTHTRYLAEQPLQLAEELLATMPREFG